MAAVTARTDISGLQQCRTSRLRPQDQGLQGRRALSSCKLGFPGCQVASRTNRVSGQSAGCRPVAVQSAPTWNPQNVPDPQIMPDPAMAAEEAVCVQLNALMHNDEPWPNHGLQTCYEFGEDIGGLDRSVYFGRRKDLYHFDHFLGHFQNVYPELLTASSYSLGDVQQEAQGCESIQVQVISGDATTNFQFLLVRKAVGKKKGSLMTRTLTKL